MRYTFFLIGFLSQFFLAGQELPPVVNYNPNDYAGGNQNWMISQGSGRNIFIANGMGLLEYSGEKWKLYPVPNKTIVRSVKAVGERIYTGAYMEAGYWEKLDSGKLKYTSLNSKFPDSINDGEQFWDIEESGGYIIFRSFVGIYLFNPVSAEVRLLPNPAGKPITNLFKQGDRIYFQMAQEGLFTIYKGKVQQVIPWRVLGEIEVMEIFGRKGELLIVTSKGQFFTWNNQDLQPVLTKLSDELGDTGVLCAVQMFDESLVLGTVGEGLYHVDAGGEILNHFYQGNGLINNTILGLFVDEENNVWAGMDNGLSVINLDSSFRIFQDDRGEIGSVYCSYQNDDFLYLGTNQGLYYRNLNEAHFELIEGTNGQVWSLQEIDGDLFCGHNSGTFLINGRQAEKISDRLGTWTVKSIPFKSDYLIQGHYNGISFLKKQLDGSYSDLPMLPGFPHSSKFIVPGEGGEVWISNEHKGVFRLQISDSLRKLESNKNFIVNDGPAITSCIFLFDENLYFSSKENIQKFDKETEEFTIQNRLNKLLNGINLVSGRIVVDTTGKIWGFGENVLFNVEMAKLSDSYEYNPVYISKTFRNITLGYENISRLRNGYYLLGTSTGYVLFNSFEEQDKDYEVRIDGIATSGLDEEWLQLGLQDKPKLNSRSNNMLFDFSIPVYKKFLAPVYKYRLMGLTPKWTDWNEQPTAIFKNLSYGEYTFEVKSKVGDYETDVSSYQFVIARPWYFSYWAIAIYLLILLLALYVAHLLYERHHRRQVEQKEKALKMQNLEAEQKIIKLENERLEQDMANKNRELAASTMSLIKKNEFLSDIKNRLQKSESTQVNSVIKTIDKDISEEDNWKFFKKAFSNADKDFFKKMKRKHPELTSNDLKLCAYLRLNLTSKEIAPLLNISTKSVEIKRYRLRKKMNLPREVNLTNYILEV
ncbi:triple tyrosine motif-containing protein [Autumnicola musiva]|uniref:Triple tyrosine motif-containing protein n=1 Tax=Autumnicola musiva TaxID=3075589 RepID=A0ABU3D5E0_9FLAO|nr:triple tyrosine motif-containing protein [Zunongwangia sp. F117]MDT0676565.1 triple tyrosine motif-containing protein [Zunongwangia sp. F117]